MKFLLYTPLTKKALRISFDAHKAQTDKTGAPYVYHPFSVAMQMTTETETCVALLHDVLEDTPITLEELADTGFPPEVIDALRLLTHDPAVPYMDYIQAIKRNPIAKKVKLADLAHNSDPHRLDQIDETMRERLEKYRRAREFLLSEESTV